MCLVVDLIVVRVLNYSESINWGKYDHFLLSVPRRTKRVVAVAVVLLKVLRVTITIASTSVNKGKMSKLHKVNCRVSHPQALLMLLLLSLLITCTSEQPSEE